MAYRFRYTDFQFDHGERQVPGPAIASHLCQSTRIDGNPGPQQFGAFSASARSLELVLQRYVFEVTMAWRRGTRALGA
jgi:hypothetical protein